MKMKGAMAILLLLSFWWPGKKCKPISQFTPLVSFFSTVHGNNGGDTPPLPLKLQFQSETKTVTITQVYSRCIGNTKVNSRAFPLGIYCIIKVIMLNIMVCLHVWYSVRWPNVILLLPGYFISYQDRCIRASIILHIPRRAVEISRASQWM